MFFREQRSADWISVLPKGNLCALIFMFSRGIRGQIVNGKNRPEIKVKACLYDSVN